MALNFDGDYSELPENLRGGILRYVEFAVQPGGFLTAVLNNDLRLAVGKADPVSLKVLPLVVRWFANERPDLYGPENFKKHLESRAA
jgi:hypothetical protein